MVVTLALKIKGALEILQRAIYVFSSSSDKMPLPISNGPGDL